MQLFYCKIDGGNFGDDMNTWFWDELFPDHKDIASEYSLFGIGSILGRQFLEGHKKVIVLGSGSGVGPFPDNMPGERIFGWVRGPLTVNHLGLDEDRAITDPAVMCPVLEPFRKIAKGRSEKLFIPHVGTERSNVDWSSVATRAGLKLLSPTTESMAMIRKIAQSEFVLTESLHGAIIADAFRVPWTAIAISPTFKSFKWEDWARSMEIDLHLATALRGPKRLYAAVRGLRSSLKSFGPSRLSSSPQGQRVRVPKGSLQNASLEYFVPKPERAVARMWVSRFKPFIEEILVRDLRNALHLEPKLSRDHILLQRQEQIICRVEEIRRRFGTLGQGYRNF